jgi:cytochrome c oxidase subunit 4
MASDHDHAHGSHDGHDHDHAGHGHDDHAHGHADDGAVHVHVSSLQFYVGIFLTLVFLTIVTVKISYFDFGAANILIAMLIATVKASLVATFFMHLLHDKLFNTLTFLAAFLFLGVFILLTYDDLGNRGHVDWAYGGTTDPRTGLAAPGSEPATTATIDESEDEAPPGAKPAAPEEKK